MDSKKQILVYSDSLSWGIIPNTRHRLEFDKRWTGILETTLLSSNNNVRVIENCLNGRKTVWEDPFRIGRDGSQSLAEVIEMHSPLALVILLLGNNDFQCTHNINAAMSAKGIEKLINIIRTAPIEPGMPSPDIMVIAPPAIEKVKGNMVEKFQGAEQRSFGFAEELEKVSNDCNVFYLNANHFIHTHSGDGIHLDEEQHQCLADAIVDYINTNISL